MPHGNNTLEAFKRWAIFCHRISSVMGVRHWVLLALLACVVLADLRGRFRNHPKANGNKNRKVWL